MSSAISVWASL